MDKRKWPRGIRPSGTGIQIRIFRDRRCIHCETVAGDPYKPGDLKAAVNRHKLLESRLILGLPVVAGDTGTTVTVASAAQDYLDTLEAKRSTSLSYENILNQYWLPVIGHWPLNDVTSITIKEILIGLKLQPPRGSTGKAKAKLAAPQDISTKTKKNILGPLRGVFQHAGLNPNPASGIKLRRRQKPKVQRYTPVQRDALLAALSGQALVYFGLLFGCGLRPGEALGLEWSDYDNDELDISKQITKRKLEMSTKTSVRRRVYVPTWVRPLLANHTTRFAKSYVFLNSIGGPHLDTDMMNMEWKAAHKKTRIPYRIPYTCRHTRAAELLSSGIAPADAAKQMGHSLDVFLRTYSEFIEEYAKDQDRSRFEGMTPKALKN